MKKTVKLYSLIGLFALGGLVLLSPEKASAADFEFTGLSLTANGILSGLPSTPVFLQDDGCATQGYEGNYPDQSGIQTTGGDCGSSGQNNPVAAMSVVYSNGVPGIMGYIGRLWFMFNDSHSGSGGVGSGNRYYFCYDELDATPHYALASCGSTIPNEATSTHFISLTPRSGTTVSTTTTVGFEVQINSADWVRNMKVDMYFSQDSAFACQNSGAVIDALTTCSGANAPASPFTLHIDPLSLTNGYNIFSTTTITFPAGGKWTGLFTVKRPTTWGLFYVDVLSSTTKFTVGQLSPMDLVRQEIQAAQAEQASTTRHGIGAILASTTASLGKACTPLSTTFNMGDCIVLLFWPGTDAISEDWTILKQTPPWGYAFRAYDILADTAATSSLPSISYSFATGTPLSSIGLIHFDPFGSLAQAGTIIAEAKSDRTNSLTVWDILMPAIKIFVYLVLFFIIMHDLTGIHSHQSTPAEKK